MMADGDVDTRGADMSGSGGAGKGDDGRDGQDAHDGEGAIGLKTDGALLG
jgi:hypothetical protein